MQGSEPDAWNRAGSISSSPGELSRGDLPTPQGCPTPPLPNPSTSSAGTPEHQLQPPRPQQPPRSPQSSAPVDWRPSPPTSPQGASTYIRDHSEAPEPKSALGCRVIFLPRLTRHTGLRHGRQERSPAASRRPAARVRRGSSTRDGSAQHRRGRLACTPLSGRYHLLQRHLLPHPPPPPARREAASPGGTEDKAAGRQPSALTPPRPRGAVRTLGGSHSKAGDKSPPSTQR